MPAIWTSPESSSTEGPAAELSPCKGTRAHLGLTPASGAAARSGPAHFSLALLPKCNRDVRS
jgi:hypothetical protein